MNLTVGHLLLVLPDHTNNQNNSLLLNVQDFIVSITRQYDEVALLCLLL